MILDYRTLLVALGVSGLCLLLTFWATWLARRADTFLFAWVVGLAFISSGIFAYACYDRYSWTWLAILSCSLTLIGFSVLLAAAYQFRTGRSLSWIAISGSVPACLITALPMSAGYDGIGFIGYNITTTMLLLATGGQYWKGRSEAPGPMVSLAVLYGMVGFSFGLCGGVLAFNHQWVIGHAPDNWSENLNVAISIAGMTGIGVVSMLLYQSRITARHAQDALTDPLTGLFNRRALFARHGEDRFGPDKAVIIFDIDRFKSVNDRYGHAAGDRAIQAFGEELQRVGAALTIARLGGEEFAAILADAMPGRAEWVAEGVRRAIQERAIAFGPHSFHITVSAGIAYGTVAGLPFDAAVNRADGALYEAKRQGRNRVEIATGDQRAVTKVIPGKAGT